MNYGVYTEPNKRAPCILVCQMFIHCKSNFTPQYPCSFYDEGNFFLFFFFVFSFTIKSHICTQLEPLPSLYFLCLVALLIVIRLIRKVVA